MQDVRVVVPADAVVSLRCGIVPFFKRVDEHVDEWVDQEESQKQNRRQQVQPCFKAFLFHNNIAPLVCVLKTDPFAGFLFKQEYLCRL